MHIFFHAYLFILCWMSLVWLISIPLKNVAIIDYAWSLGFLGVSLVAYHLGTNHHVGLVIAIGIWGIRLFTHLLLRKTHIHEDKRYTDIRNYYGKNFWWQSYAILFLAQGTFMAIMATPLILIQTTNFTEPTTFQLAIRPIAWAFWLLGMTIESQSDYQLLQFKTQHPKQLCTVGWWRYSRHPNYFGEIIIWWSMYAIFISHCEINFYSLAASISPLFITIAIIHLSGVLRMEKTMPSRYKEFPEYAKKTSMLIPWWPKEKN